MLYMRTVSISAERLLTVFLFCVVTVSLVVWAIVVGLCCCFFFFQAEDGIRDLTVTGVQTCALPISPPGFRLLQAKLFPRRQECDRFANAPLARFRSFSHMNPNDEVTSVGGCQLPKEIGRASCRERV